MISVIIPTLNEQAHIGGLLKKLLGEADAELAEVIVADGGSTDETRVIVESVARIDSRVRLLDNPRKLQAAGVNLAALRARSDVTILVRIDAHADYPTGYVARLAELLRQTSGQSVVVRLRSIGASCMQKAIAAVSNSRWGTGGAVHRVGGASGWIDHGHHAAFDRSAFLALGGYDESFIANEDAEFDLRLTKAGGRIWFEGDVEVLYYTRATLTSLARQYFRYGEGRARTLRKAGALPRLRQCIAPVLTLGVVVSLIIAPIMPWTLAAPLSYAIAAISIGAVLAFRSGDPCVGLGGLALMVMHLAWGSGFIISFAREKLKARASLGK